MNYKQTQMLLEPTSIEELFQENADNETLAQAMLLNWETIGSLITKEDYWRCLLELDDEFIWDNVLNECDIYKGFEYRTLIIKIRDRYFAYDYTTSAYDDDCYHWEEVKPICAIHYKVEYVSKDSPEESCKNTYDKRYKELFWRN